MKTIDRYEFHKYVIAQDSESGYVVVLQDGIAAIGRYSHCSCYGTWSCVDGGTPSYIWEGSEEELIYLAKNKLDPSMPIREADPQDYDYDHLMAIYQQVLNRYGVS